jgi:hypothetical protein
MQRSVRNCFVCFTILLILWVCGGCAHSQGTQPPAEKTVAANPYVNAEITTRIIPSRNNTFGYEVLIDGRKVIHQPSIPGLPGNEGFRTEEQAQKVVDLVVQKIRKNEMPPTVTAEELKELGATKP